MVLSCVRYKFAMVYVDDLIVFSKTNDEHMSHMKAFIKLLKDGGLTLKLDKLLFLETLVEYLGHTISPRCLHFASIKCNAVKAIQLPTYVTQLRSFLGYVTYIDVSFRILHG